MVGSLTSNPPREVGEVNLMYWASVAFCFLILAALLVILFWDKDDGPGDGPFRESTDGEWVLAAVTATCAAGACC